MPFSTPPVRVLLLWFASAALCLDAVSVAAAELDDVLVLHNGSVYTSDGERLASAVAIDRNGVIVAVGSSAAITRTYGAGVDLDGATVLPGFQDAHVHVVEAAINRMFCEMAQFGDADQRFDELRYCAGEARGSDWVIAAGVNMAALLASVPDLLRLADEAVGNRPLLVLDDLGHGAWTNSAGLRRAGLRAGQSPPGSVLTRDRFGALTGVVLEAAAQTLIDTAMPASDWLPRVRRQFPWALQQLARNGITTVSDAGGYWPRGHEQVWFWAERAGLLTVRASNALFVYPGMAFDEQLPELLARFRSRSDSLVRFDQAKIYVDGILSQGTGYLDQPYRRRLFEGAGHRGLTWFDRARLYRYSRALAAAGFSLHFHVTGGAGARLALDAIEQTAGGSGPHRLTHLYLVAPEDRRRFAQLGAFADLQLPVSARQPAYLADLRALLGRRVDAVLPLRALLAANAQVTISSDWDADVLSPLVKLQALLTDSDRGVDRLEDALALMTINPARLLRHDHVTGSIEVGKFADLVILDADLFDTPFDEIGAVQVLATLLQGDPVYDPEGLFAAD